MSNSPARRAQRRSRRSLIDMMVSSTFLYFVQKVFETVSPADTYVDDWYIEAMCYELEKVRHGLTRRLLITLPPRYLKSICGSVAFAAWMIAKDPAIRILDISYGDALSNERSMMFRQVIESSWYKRMFPQVEIISSSNEVVRTAAGGYRRAVSMKGALTGIGADLIIIDDIIKAQNIHSEGERESVELNFRSAVLSRLNNKRKGAVVVLGQRLHDDDLPGFLIRSGRYQHLCLPAIAIEDAVYEIGGGQQYHRRKGEVLSPEREPIENLDETREESGSGVFEAQYQQNPGASESGLLRWHEIPTYYDPPPRGELEQVVISWDTGNTPNPRSDYSVGTVWGFARGRWYLLHLYRGQWAFPDLIARARSTVVEWGATFLIIEDYGSGTSLLQQLFLEMRRQEPWARETGCLVRSMKPRLDKETRFAAQTERLTNGKFLFPASAPWLGDLRREMLSFPDHHRHADQVDSISQFLEWVSGSPEGLRLARGGRRPKGRERPQGPPRRAKLIRTRDLLALTE